MKFCTNCGAQLEDAAKFCSKCGHAASVEAVEPAVEPEKLVEEQMVEISESVDQEQVVAIEETEDNGIKGKAKGILTKVIALLKKHYKIVIAVAAVLVAIIVGVSIYNSTHCSYGSCNNSVADGSSYCYTHKCNLCSSSKKYNSNYCYYHDTLYNSSSSSSSSSTTGNATTDLKFSNIKVEHNSLYTVVTGTVTNKGTRTYKFVTVKGAFKTSSGTVVDTDSTYAVGSEGLAKGESTTFRMSVDKNTSIKSCAITITGYK